MALLRKASVLKNKLGGLSRDSFVLVNVVAEDVTPINVEAVKVLQSNGYSGVYVSLSKDYLAVVTMLEDADVDLSQMRFVDATSRMYGIAPVESAEVVYVDGPLSMDSLIEGVAASLRRLKDEKRFVLLDSLTTLLLYNSPDATVAFNKALKKLLKKEGAAGLIIVAYRGSVNEDLIKRLNLDGDDTIAVGGGSES